MRRVERLVELREIRGRTQEEVAARFGAAQPAISKLEHRRHPAMSDVKYYVEALGGELSVVARFPDGEVIEIRPGDDGPPSSH